ncbi:transfer protein [Kitasatospora sp. NPDC002040]|uniref:transfer protein n=1 Tax=Kitasatospora sp. NPDC002040 TaxID=3154661 RepID=UPI003322694B
MALIYEVGVRAPAGDVIGYDMPRLADAMNVMDPARLAVETVGSRGLVTIYPEDPLEEVLLPDPAELLMDSTGRIWVGRHHNGRRTKVRLYDPKSGSAQRLILFGTTGAGKSTGGQILLAGMKRSGVTVFYADLKGGQSAPEARANCDWCTYTQEGAIAQLRTYWNIMKEREARYAAAGRSKFLMNRPDPLMYMIVDEANRLLEKGAPYRDEATFYIKDIGRTGRSLGMGIALFAQAGHLEELGGSDTLRSMLKEGEVILLRWTSNLMRQLVSDGLLPAGQKLAAIPKYAGVVELVSQFDDTEADEDRPGTQGNGYHLSGTHPTSRMRFFKVGSEMPTDGLDPEMLALYGDGPVPTLEESSWEAAGRAYAGRLDGMAAYQAACPEKFKEPETGGRGQGRGGSGGGSRPVRSAPVPVIPVSAPGEQEPARPRRLTIGDRILAVLESAEAPMDTIAILDAVNADGGKVVKLGSIKAAMTALNAAARDDQG